MLDRDQRLRVGNPQPLRVARAQALGAQLGLYLRARPMHQDQPDADGGEQVEVMQEFDEPSPLGDQFAAEPDDEGAAAERVHVRRRLAEPAHESFGMRQGTHGFPDCRSCGGF